MVLNPEFFKQAFEITCFIIFFICFYHSLSNYGFSKTIREFTAGFILSAGCENMGVLSGAYVYPGFHVYFFEIPLANPLSWIALVYLIMEITNRIIKYNFNRISFFSFILFIAFVDSTFALMVDLMMDPLATVYNWWIWVDSGQTKVLMGDVIPYNFSDLSHIITPDNWVYDFFKGNFTESRYPTRWFGIPLINYISWFVFVFVFSVQFRWIESKIGWSNFKKNIILWFLVILDIPVLSLLLISPNV